MKDISFSWQPINCPLLSFIQLALPIKANIRLLKKSCILYLYKSGDWVGGGGGGSVEGLTPKPLLLAVLQVCIRFLMTLVWLMFRCKQCFQALEITFTFTSSLSPFILEVSVSVRNIQGKIKSHHLFLVPNGRNHSVMLIISDNLHYFYILSITEQLLEINSSLCKELIPTIYI